MSLIPAEDIKKKSAGGGLIKGGVFERVGQSHNNTITQSHNNTKPITQSHNHCCLYFLRRWSCPSARVWTLERVNWSGLWPETSLSKGKDRQTSLSKTDRQAKVRENIDRQTDRQ